MTTRLYPLSFLLAFFLVSCGDEKESDPSENQEGGKAGQSSLFSPVNEQHGENMDARAAEQAEINRRIEEAAKKRELEFLNEVDEKLAEYKAHFSGQHADQIQKQVDADTAEVKSKYLEQVQATYDKAQTAGLSVLSGELAEEKKRFEAGGTPPTPPADSSTNPGLSNLFELRGWYHESMGNVENFKTQAEASLNKAYGDSLAKYQEYVAQVSPEDGVNKVKAAVAELDGEWWK